MSATPTPPRVSAPGLAPGRPRKPLNLLDLALRRGVLLLVVGGLLSLLLAPVFMMRGRSVYTTSGMMAIDPGKEPTLTGRERETIPGNIGDYTRTLLNRMTSGDVLTEAMDRVPPGQWPSFLNPERPPEANIGRLFRAIKAKEVARTYLMSVEISGEDAKGLAPMLNAVLEAFLAKLRQELEQQNARRHAYLIEERDSIIQRIATERQHILDLAEALPTKAFLHESYSVHLSKVEQIQRLYWEAEALRAERAGDVFRDVANWRDIRALSLQPYADERVADNFGINRIEQWTYEQLQSLRSTIDGLTTNNQDRSYVEMRMEAMNQYLREYKASVNESTIRILDQKRDHDLASALIVSSNALAGAATASRTLADSLEKARIEASDISEAIFRATEMSFTVTQLRERLTAINNRIDDLQMESKAPLRVYIDRLAGDPRRPTSNTTPQLGMLGVALAFGLVLAIVIGFEILDDRVRGQREVAAALGGTPPDPIPDVTDGPAERVLLDRPDSPAGVALRGLAVRLDRERLRHAARIFALCPAGPDTGNTALALNIAQALAGLTPRVLLLSLGPSGLGTRAGVAVPDGAAMLRDPAALPSAIAPDPIRHIDLAAAEASGAGLLDKTGLAALLSLARERYDAVVLDLLPAPKDDLAMAALHHADAAVLTIREDRTMYRDLRQAIDAAVAAGIPALTAILNATRRSLANPSTATVRRLLGQVTRIHQAVVAGVRQRLRRQVPPPANP